MLRLDHISKIYPTGEVLKDITWEVKPGERLGLVGPNGTGKTTQFKIIAGEIEPTSGSIIKSPGLKIAYMTQEFEVDPDNTVREELSSVFTEIHDIVIELHDVHKKLETASPEELDKLLKKMDRLQHEFEVRGGYQFEVKVDKVLPDIGFSIADAERKVGEFSGGWQMRISIGKLLLQQPDVLLLDEPTNHLDLETIEWLETYLKGLTTPMVIVSHDRMFLDRLCNRIVEIERGESTTYIGNYSRYQEIKEETRQSQQAAYERQQKELERQQVFIDRFRASANRSTQAKSREKQLDKIELIDEPESELRTLQFRFPVNQKSGRHVVSIKNLTHAYDENVLFLGANLEIERGNKIAILGPNGSGKSTLLRLITGSEQPFEGTVQLGEHNVHPAYFEQNQAEALDLSKSVLDTIADEVPQWKTEEVRSLLGRFLFSGDTVFKKVEALSGGEKARLALAKMLLGPANFLILDEPTNHLDIPAKETVEEAIRAYEGTVIVVSHDRYFISRVANRIIEIRDGQLRSFDGDYDYYCEQINKEKEAALKAKQEAEEAARLAEKRAKQKEKERQKAQAKKSGLLLLLCLLLGSPVFADDSKWVQLSEQGMAAYKQGSDSNAEQLLRAAVEEARKFGDSDMRLARSLHNLATVYTTEKKWTQAEATLKEAIAVKEKALGPNDPDVARTLNNLAVLYFDQYEYKQAEACYKQVLAIDERSLPSRHPERLTTLRNYSLLLHRLGREKEAAEIDKLSGPN